MTTGTDTPVGRSREDGASDAAAPCRLCGGPLLVPIAYIRDNRTGAHIEPFLYTRCTHCGLVGLRPLPGPGEAIAGHESGYADMVASASPRASPGEPAGAKHGAGNADQVIIRSIRYLWHLLDGMPSFDRLPLHGRILDVGAGTGETLELLLEAGLDAVGIEPNRLAVDAARRRGLPVVEGSSEHPGYPPESFDTVLLNQVIEHLVDPVRSLGTLRQLLRPGGRLVVTTPNVMGWPRRLFRREWAHWHAPYHVHLYGPTQLRRTLVSAGFRTESVRTLTPAFWLNMSIQLARRNSQATGWQLPPTGWQPPHLARVALAPVTRPLDAIGMGDCLVAVGNVDGHA